MDHVTPQRPPDTLAGGFQAPGDVPLERDQSGRRDQPRLLGQPAAVGAERAQRFGLAAGRHLRLHQQAHRTLTQRMLEDQALQIGHGPTVMTEGDQRAGPLLPGHSPQVGETSRLRSCPPLAGELAEGFAGPERERPVVALDRPVRQRRLGVGDERLELVHVEDRAVALQPVARAVRRHVSVTDCGAQP